MVVDKVTISAVGAFCKTWSKDTGDVYPIPTLPAEVITTGLEVDELTWNFWEALVTPIPTLPDELILIPELYTPAVVKEI